jgi:uncharacterized membrane protein
MMFLWLPFVFFLFFVPWMLFRPARYGYGPGCGMHHAMDPSMHGTPMSAGSDPVQIVRERLARGEITPEEYEAILRKLA